MNALRQQALLLIGPTGSGKTPSGELCEQKGLWGRTIHHFDFGRQLRQAARRSDASDGLSENDLSVIRRSLQTGALLEKENFRIAEKILERFFRDRGVAHKHLLILNGLPRHVRQAEQVDAIVEIVTVVYLRCSPEVVYGRIVRNIGGDRTNRTDDTEAEVRNKLSIFQERTLPLVQHYREKRVNVEEIDVGTNSSAVQIQRRLESIGSITQSG